MPFQLLSWCCIPEGVCLHKFLSPCGPFKRSLLKIQQFIPPPQAHCFLQPEVMGIYLLGAGILGCVVWPGAGILRYPSQFSSTSCECETTHSVASLGHMASPRLLAPSPGVRPSYRLDECFFFISLVVRLPYSSIFCQFWLCFVFKLLLSFFWLCKGAQCAWLCGEAQCICPRLRLGRKSGCHFNFPGANNSTAKTLRATNARDVHSLVFSNNF